MKEKEVLTIFIFILASLIGMGQNPQPRYHPSSSILVADETSRALNLGINFINQPQMQAIYGVNDFLFVYGTFNLKNDETTLSTQLFGKKNRLWEQNGFSLGAGTQSLGGSGFFNHIEALIGYEIQNISITENFESTPDIKVNMTQTLNYIKSQINIIHGGDRWDLGAALKGSYVLFQDTEIDDLEHPIQGKSAIIMNASLLANYRLIPDRPLLLHAQLGYDFTFEDVEYIDESESSIKGTGLTINSVYLKLGIHYRFNSDR